MRARKVLLLLVILTLGGGIEAAWQVRNNLTIGPSGCRVLSGKFYGPSYAFDSKDVQKVPEGTSVEIQNAFGAVRVSAGGTGEVRTSLRTVVYQQSESAAREFSTRVHLQPSLDGKTLRLGTNRRELDDREVGFETHLEVTVPPGTSVKVSDEHGAVDVSDVADAVIDSSFDALRVERASGSVDLKSRHGDVSVASVGGALTLFSRHGDVEARGIAGHATLDVEHGDVTVEDAAGLKIDLHFGELTAEKLRGDLDARGEHAQIRATDVSGDAAVETAFQDLQVAKVGGAARLKLQHGDLHASHVKGSLDADASYGDVTLEDIGGPATVKVVHGGLHGQGLHKGARVTASGDDVTLEEFRGPIEVEVKTGSARLVPDGPLSDSVSVSAANGGISLEVPVGSRFDLTASAQSGEVTVDVPGLEVSESAPTRVAAKLGGGGSLVKLQTDHGDVSVSRREALASKDE